MNTHKTMTWRLATLFPFIILIAWTIKVQLSQTNGRPVRLKIVGYDPIDFLSGHYLRFRYDLGTLNLCQGKIDRAQDCVCLASHTDGTMEANAVVECSAARDKCPDFIRGECRNGVFFTSSERFYFPEEYAIALAVVPPDSQALVNLNSDGTIALKDIFVGPQRILDYAKDQLK